MTSAAASPGVRIRRLWTRLSSLPGGRWLFSRLLARMVPYSGTIRATVVHLEPGHAIVRLADRRRVRNHLRSIHAIAMANLGELATGLAVIVALGPETRGILTRITVTYTKKARGTLEAEARCEIPTVSDDVEETIEAHIRDATGDTVAIAKAQWRLSPTVPRTTS